MKRYFKNSFVIILFFLVHAVFCMDQGQVSTPMNPGIFNKLEKYKDARNVLFGSLEPKDWNALHKTCTRFSKHFSFCNPSTEFVLCNSLNMHKKDKQRIFFTAVYDGNHEIAKFFANNKEMRHRYKIAGTSYVLYPHLIAQANKDEEMSLLLKHLEAVEVKRKRFGCDFNSCEANPLLIACVSRNSERVKKVLTDSKTILNDFMVQLALHVVIDGGDMQSFAIMFEDLKMLEYIKENGAILISQTLSCGSRELSQALISSNLCDLNKKMVQEPIGMKGYSDEQAQLVRELYSFAPFTLLDHFLGEGNMYREFFGDDFFEEMKEMLIKNGAKTSDELKQ